MYCFICGRRRVAVTDFPYCWIFQKDLCISVIEVYLNVNPSNVDNMTHICLCLGDCLLLLILYRTSSLISFVAEWGASDDSAIFSGNDGFRASRCVYRRIRHHSRKCHGGLHIIWCMYSRIKMHVYCWLNRVPISIFICRTCQRMWFL